MCIKSTPYFHQKRANLAFTIEFFMLSADVAQEIRPKSHL